MIGRWYRHQTFAQFSLICVDLGQCHSYLFLRWRQGIQRVRRALPCLPFWCQYLCLQLEFPRNWCFTLHFVQTLSTFCLESLDPLPFLSSCKSLWPYRLTAWTWLRSKLSSREAIAFSVGPKWCDNSSHFEQVKTSSCCPRKIRYTRQPVKCLASQPCSSSRARSRPHFHSGWICERTF